MSPNPDAFITHLRNQGYHPRSNKHSNALAEAIAEDLVEGCHCISQAAAEKRLVYDLNFDIRVATSNWNVDLVLGKPPHSLQTRKTGSIIENSPPSSVEIAIEIKSVMTEHRKAIRNRKRDLEAHHDHVHRYDNGAIAGGVLVLNEASRFQSPLRDELTEHGDSTELIRHCMHQARSISTRSNTSNHGLEALTVLVVNMDNVNVAQTKYGTSTQVPQVGDPLHYDSFVQRICRIYENRFTP